MTTLQRYWTRYHTWIGALLTAALLAASYGFVVRLPFFHDDLLIVPWLRGHSWGDIWTQTENGTYYRPLAFVIYKAALLLPVTVQAGVLHGLTLACHWALVLEGMAVVRRWGRAPAEALLAGVLLAVFPFMIQATVWITALSHPLVAALALLALYGMLRAEEEHRPAWWGLSLAATALAPLAHESGVVCCVLVGGWLLIRYGWRRAWQRAGWVIAGGVLNGGAFLLRQAVIAGGGMPLGAHFQDFPQNVMFFLHGLVYPAGPLIGWLALRRGWHDFTLIGVTALVLAAWLIWRAWREREWRWSAAALWWWFWSALPAALLVDYGGLFVSPRLYVFVAPGIVLLWAGLLADAVRRRRWVLRGCLAMGVGALLVQNVAYLRRERSLLMALNALYQPVLQLARAEPQTPLGVVNLPRWLIWRDRPYALVSDGMVFVPPYSDFRSFVQVNIGTWGAADAVTFPPVLQETDPVIGSLGETVDWAGLRQFAVERPAVWLARYEEGHFVLREVGQLTPHTTAVASPLASFEGGGQLEAATLESRPDGTWALTLTWWAAGPVEAQVFVHVIDATGALVAQADGAALGGMVPLAGWQAGDRLRDVRTLTLPPAAAPYTVRVGLYNAAGRLPAFQQGQRCPEDAVLVGIIR